MRVNRIGAVCLLSVKSVHLSRRARLALSASGMLGVLCPSCRFMFCLSVPDAPVRILIATATILKFSLVAVETRDARVVVEYGGIDVIVIQFVLPL
ncbi:MAG TPA: hypothetical protein DEV93_03750, partial [Chloroflexi bacterium]|nr:hypothetical protein [Chloroflexota bacterium]